MTGRNEEEVLSNLVDNIQQNSSLMNGHIRKMFSLDNILFRGGKLMNKNQMMEELSIYENLISAMGALFYVNKRMNEKIPCIFQSLKEYTFEAKARKIRKLLSNEKKIKAANATAGVRAQGTFETTDGNVFDSKDFSQRMILKGLSSATGGDHHIQGLGSEGMTINYDGTVYDEHQMIKGGNKQNRMLLMDEEEMEAPADGMDEDFEFAGDNYNEEYVQVHNGKMNAFISP